MDTKIILVLFATSFVFLILIFLINFILSYQKRNISFNKEKELMRSQFDQTLLESQIEVQEATFSFLSKELHDNVGQLLNTSKSLLHTTHKILKETPETFQVALNTLSLAIVELRSLSKALDKHWLEQFDLIDNLTTEIRRINSANVLKINFSHGDKIELDSEKQIILFRIIQESLQNVVKHADAHNINIAIEMQQKNIFVSITDDGKGFHPDSNPGLGINNMKHRTNLLEGNITWDKPVTGSSVIITIPVKENIL